MGHDNRTCPAEENDEAICQLFNTIGKQLDESPSSHCFNDAYFNWLKEPTINPQLAPHLRFMVCVVLGLWKNNWIPHREEVSFTLFLFVDFMVLVFWNINYIYR